MALILSGLAAGAPTPSFLAQKAAECFALEDSLGLDSAFDVSVDPDGYPWLGGYRVYGRFDGSGFSMPAELAEVFREIRGGQAPLFAADGTTWFSREGALTAWAQDRRHDLPPADPGPPPVLAVDENALWLSTPFAVHRREHQQGFDASALDWGRRVYTLPQRMGLSRSLIRQGDQLWWLLDRGLIQLQEGRGDQFGTLVEVARFGAESGLPESGLRALRVDPDQTLLIASDQGVWQRAPGSREFQPLPGTEQMDARDILPDASGRLWIASAGNVLQLRHPDGRLQRWGPQQGLPATTIYRIASGLDGELWIATEGSGICRIALPLFTVIGAENGLRNDVVRAIALDPDDALWVGGPAGLTHIADEHIEHFEPWLPLTGTVVALELQADRLWLAAEHGLFVVRDQQLHRMPVELSTPISSLAYAADGWLWLAGDFGLGRLRVQSGEFEDLGPVLQHMSDRRVRSLRVAAATRRLGRHGQRLAAAGRWRSRTGPGALAEADQQQRHAQYRRRPGWDALAAEPRPVSAAAGPA